MFLRKYWLPLSVFLVAIVGVSLYYLQTRPPKEPIIIYKPVEPLPKSEVKAPVGDTSQGGHFHSDGTWHEGSHAAEVEAPERAKEQVADVSAQTPPQIEYDRGAGNPPPFDKVPVDLWDFEATKAAMIENVNFVKANWDPETYYDVELGREMRIADAIAHNISNATYMHIFTPEQGEELRTLYMGLLEFQGIEHGRIRQLIDEGHTREEAGRIAAEETLQRQGVK